MKTLTLTRPSATLSRKRERALRAAVPSPARAGEGGAKRRVRAIFVALMLLLAHPAAACTVCMGAPGDPLVEGANRGIWVLLAIIFAVQIGFVALFWSFWKRARDLKKFRDQFRVIQGGSLSVYPDPKGRDL